MTLVRKTYNKLMANNKSAIKIRCLAPMTDMITSSLCNYKIAFIRHKFTSTIVVA